MTVNLIWITPDPEYHIEYCARASSPKNQKKMEEGDLTPGKLLRYCAEHGHWSIFEMASACFSIETTRAISAQILRHRSFSFQEFSQRYARPDMSQGFQYPEMRAAAEKRQGSGEPKESVEVRTRVEDAIGRACHVFEQLVEDFNVAPETARMVLPMCTPTKLFMSGTVRSWIHYLSVRTKPNVQKEHREIALSIQDVLASCLPKCAEAFNW